MLEKMLNLYGFVLIMVSTGKYPLLDGEKLTFKRRTIFVSFWVMNILWLIMFTMYVKFMIYLAYVMFFAK